MSDDSFRRVARIGLAPLVEEPPEAPDWHAVSADAVLEGGSPRRNSWTPVVLATTAVLLLVIAAVLLRREHETPPVLGTDWSTVAFPEGFSGVNATTTWTGDELIVWGGQAENVDETPTGEPGWAYDPSTGAWRELPPSPKRPTVGAASVWTGDQLIICCGAGDLSADFNETVAYDPAADQWRRLADSPLSGTYTQAIWTGDVMLVVASGGVAAYDPDLDTWQTYSAPPEETRIGEIAWTGDELIVWSREVERAVHSGFALSLESDTWRRLPDPPAWPAAPDIVWTDDRLVIWGGLPARSGGSERAVGSVYDPQTDTWSAMSEVLPEPEPFEGNLGSQSLFWTGHRVLVSPGAFSSGVPNGETPILTYDPTNDTWEQVDSWLLPPILWFGEAIQAGDRTILISDQLHISPPGWIPEGDPVTAETWAVVASSTTTPAQTENTETPPDWTITEIPFAVREGSTYATGGGWFFAWGGAVDRTGDLRSDGILVDIDTGEWVEVPEAPISWRYQSSSVWTGSSFIVFGGHDFDRSYIDGAAFDPETRQWSLITPAPLEPAAHPAAVWDGTSMVVWLAGDDSAFAESAEPAIGQLAVYDASTDSWSPHPSPDVEMVDADLIIDGNGVVLVGGPSMRDQSAGSTRSLYVTWWSNTTQEWSGPLLGPGVDAARLFRLPGGELGVLTDRSRLYTFDESGWAEVDIGSDLPPELANCWWDLGAASGAGQAYLKLCGYDYRFSDPTLLEEIIQPHEYGATANLYGSAFVVDEQGRLIVFGDSPLPSATGTPNALFGVYQP